MNYFIFKALFNLLEARGAISVSQRVAIIARIRRLARMAARVYLNSRQQQGFPWIKDEAVRQKMVERYAPRKPKEKKKAETAAAGGRS